jgi:hypothetical protein
VKNANRPSVEAVVVPPTAKADRELAVKLLIVPTGCATIHAVDRIAAAVLRAVAK